MDAEVHWIADRTLLRSLLRAQPSWTHQDLADATHRSRGWVKKWLARLRAAPPDDEHVLYSQSRARKQPLAGFDPRVIDRILTIRDQPPDHLQRTPGPKAILYYLARDRDLQAANLRLPRSTRTVWQILRQHGRIPIPGERRHTPVERPAPMTAWQLDFKDVSTVPADPDGKRQHVVEVLNSVDVGTSLLVAAQVRPDFTAETTIESLVATFRGTGLPASITWTAIRGLLARRRRGSFRDPCCGCCIAWALRSPFVPRAVRTRMPLSSASIARLNTNACAWRAPATRQRRARSRLPFGSTIPTSAPTRR
jgi:hypothetical protein